MHDKLLKVVRTLETDYEPYGKVERDSPDCSCGCRHFVKLAGDVGEEWGVCVNSESARAGLLTFEHQGCPEFEPILLDRALTDSQLRALIAEASAILKDRRRERTDSVAAEETPLPDERGEFTYDVKTSYFPRIKGHAPEIFRLEPHDGAFVAIPLASRTSGKQRPMIMGRYQNLKCDEIVGIRYGIYKRYVNGIRTSRSYAIWLSDRHSSVMIE